MSDDSINLGSKKSEFIDHDLDEGLVVNVILEALDGNLVENGQTLDAIKYLKWLKPEIFNNIYAKCIIGVIDSFYKEGITPTRRLVRNRLIRAMTTDTLDYQTYLDMVDRRPSPQESACAIAGLKDWCTDKIYGLPYTDHAFEARKAGNKELFKEIFNKIPEYLADLEDDAAGIFSETLGSLLKKEIHNEWIIEGIMNTNQPFIMSAPQKSFKTAMLADMALSVASGVPFLNHFRTPKPRKVVFFSGESGEIDMQMRFRSIMESKNLTKEQIELAESNLITRFDIPKLANAAYRAMISKELKKNSIELLILDPMYLALMNGDEQIDSSMLYQMGPQLGKISKMCTDVDCTPILVFHDKKSASAEFDLANSSGAGIAEFARQSLRIKRVGKYTGPTNNRMQFATHGFARGTVYNWRIDEGPDHEHPKWKIEVSLTANDTKSEIKAKYHEKAEKMVDHLIQNPNRSKTQMCKSLKFSNQTCGDVISYCLEKGLIILDNSKATATYTAADN